LLAGGFPKVTKAEAHARRLGEAINLRKHIGGANMLPALFCLAGIALNHAVFRLGALSPLWTVATVSVLGAIFLLAPNFEISAEPAGKPQYWQAGIGLVVIAPVLASLVLGWDREYPFSGDQSFHLKHVFYMLYWWVSAHGTPPLPLHDFPGAGELRPEHFRQLLAKPWQLLWSRAVLMIVIAAITAWWYRQSRHWAFIFASVSLLSWGLFEQSIYFRYPAGGYWLPMVFTLPSYIFGNIEHASRVPNALAPAVWLFALRPWLVGRWPDLKILPIAALILWHKDAIFYFDSAYIEPWALVFALLAVEVIVARGAQAAPLACLLIGAASCIKEPFIFALPFLWLAGAPWRQSWHKVSELTGAAIAAGWPFVLYYAARKSVAIEFQNVPQTPETYYFDRTVVFDFSLSSFLQYFKAYWFNSITAFGGAVFVAATAISIIVVVWKGRRSVPLACVLGAGIFSLLFFAFDSAGSVTPGYFRFLLFALPFLLVGIVSLGYELKPRILIAVGMGILLVQLPSAYTGIARSAQGSSDRNFVEFYNRPIVFPIKALLSEAARKGLLPRGTTVYANRPDITVKSVPGIIDNVQFGQLGELQCACTAAHPNIMDLFVRYANMDRRFADTPPTVSEAYGPNHEADWIWRNNRAAREQCLARMQQTCRNFLSRTEGGEVVGALGMQ
jgi:hypothetical protein